MKTVGSRAEVWHGTAKKTSGGLLKKDLKKNKRGRIVSKKMSNRAKKEKRLEKAGYKTKKGVFKKFKAKKGGGDKEIIQRLGKRRRNANMKMRNAETKLQKVLNDKGNLQNKMHRRGIIGMRRRGRKLLEKASKKAPILKKVSKKLTKRNILNENERRLRDILVTEKSKRDHSDKRIKNFKQKLNKRNEKAAKNVVTANMFNIEEAVYENKEKKGALEEINNYYNTRPINLEENRLNMLETKPFVFKGGRKTTKRKTTKRKTTKRKSKK